VIIGAEYAYGAILHGRSVRIVYLTCSGPNAEAEISQTRRIEAISAWSTLGVSAANLTFIDLSESAIDGPTYYSAEEVNLARRIFKSSILALPEHAAVVIPANGESHVDHRMVRQLALEALLESKRTDLICYESPEYNDHLSLLCAPERTMRTILRHLPGLRRLIAPYAGPTGYIEGSVGFTFRDPAYLAKKKELLKHFASQDGNVLLGFLGYLTTYRELDLSGTKAGPERKVGFHAFGHVCDFSALAWGCAIWCVIFLMTYTIGNWVSHALSQPLAFDAPVSILSVLSGCVYVVRALCKRVSMETALYACTACFGLAIAVI
jgi:hypothetical protein